VADFAAVGAFAFDGLDGFLGFCDLDNGSLDGFTALALAVAVETAVGAFARDRGGRLGGVACATVVAGAAAVRTGVGGGLGHNVFDDKMMVLTHIVVN
jgi:hypothetical protein